MMRRMALPVVVCASLARLLDGGEPSRSTPVSSHADRSYGTALQWENNLQAAGRKAERAHKLLMVLAVAGHFEDPFFT